MVYNGIPYRSYEFAATWSLEHFPELLFSSLDTIIHGGGVASFLLVRVPSAYEVFPRIIDTQRVFFCLTLALLLTWQDYAGHYASFFLAQSGFISYCMLM